MGPYNSTTTYQQWEIMDQREAAVTPHWSNWVLIPPVSMVSHGGDMPGVGVTRAQIVATANASRNAVLALNGTVTVPIPVPIPNVAGLPATDPRTMGTGGRVTTTISQTQTTTSNTIESITILASRGNWRQARLAARDLRRQYGHLGISVNVVKRGRVTITNDATNLPQAGYQGVEVQVNYSSSVKTRNLQTVELDDNF